MYDKDKYPFNFSDGGGEPVDVYAGPPFEAEPDNPFAWDESEGGAPRPVCVYMGPPARRIKRLFGKYKCEHCGKPVKRSDNKCPHCGTWLC